MTSAVQLYEALASAPDERVRARLIAEAFEAFEDRFPEAADVATRADVREAELRLIKEIELVRAEAHESELRLRKEIEVARGELLTEIKRVDAENRKTELRLTKEIEQVRGEILETELRLTKEIAQVRGDLTKQIEEIRSGTLKWVAGMLGVQTITIIAAVVGALSLLP